MILYAKMQEIEDDEISDHDEDISDNQIDEEEQIFNDESDEWDEANNHFDSLDDDCEIKYGLCNCLCIKGGFSPK